jgi:hypothetical protein
MNGDRRPRRPASTHGWTIEGIEMKRMKHLGVMLALGALVAAGIMVSPASASTFYPATNGQWGAYPGQSTTYGAAVQQPINSDGSSNFKANGKTVIPVKFALSQGTGPFVFESIGSDVGTANDYSLLQWQAKATNGSFTLNQLTTLIANYQFTTGNCHAGSLRWTVTLQDGAVQRNLDIHYQPGENSLSDQFCQTGTSGTNRVDVTSTDPYVVINQFIYAGTPYTFTSANPVYNTTYSDALSQLGNLVVVQNGINLILDSGFAGDQRLTLTSAAVGVGNGAATPYTETWTPLPASPMTTTCPTAEAKFTITKVDGLPSGDVNEPLTIQPQDNNGIYRIVDCKYMYNLATSSLSGVGTYTVKATIGSTTFTVATFDLK